MSVTPNEPQQTNGRLWTIVGFVALLGAVYLATYKYVIPRLGQQPISSSAPLSFRLTSTEEVENWTSHTLADGSGCYVASEAQFDAGHFAAVSDARTSNPPQITFVLSKKGRRRLNELQQQDDLKTMVCVVGEDVIAEIPPAQWTDAGVSVPLAPQAGYDVSDVMAQLIR